MSIITNCWVKPQNKKAIDWLKARGYRLSKNVTIDVYSPYRCCALCSSGGPDYQTQRKYVISPQISGRKFHKMLKDNGLLLKQQ